MIIYRHQISHEWERRNILRHVKAGRVKKDEVCDADFLLVTAANFHGQPAQRVCPICDGELRTVKWIYGEQLGRKSGTARSDEEIADIIAVSGPVTVHNVEVCPNCKWNHLLTEAQAELQQPRAREI